MKCPDTKRLTWEPLNGSVFALLWSFTNYEYLNCSVSYWYTLNCLQTTQSRLLESKSKAGFNLVFNSFRTFEKRFSGPVSALRSMQIPIRALTWKISVKSSILCFCISASVFNQSAILDFDSKTPKCQVFFVNKWYGIGELFVEYFQPKMMTQFGGSMSCSRSALIQVILVVSSPPT